MTVESTTMLGPFVLGFLLGMKHALEADHVAAVAALATRSPSAGARVKLAGMWGLGHAATLFVFGAAVIALGLSVPPALANGLEGLVGVVLVVLGIDVLRRLRRRQVHVHAHHHGDGTLHLHAHAHEGAAADHTHEHPTGLLSRALVVGTVHGLAGSAALVLLSLEVARSTAQAFAYLALFGVGSIAGMCVLSLAISLPMQLAPGRLRVHRGFEGVLGVLTIALGSWIAVGVALGR
jgi:hypothetical protein